MHSRATDRRSASKCQGKWQIRPSTKRSVTRGAGSGQHLASVLQQVRENANIECRFGIHPENLGLNLGHCGGAYGGDGNDRGWIGRQMPKVSAGRFTKRAFWLRDCRPRLSILIGRRPRRGGFLVSFPISKQNFNLRSCSRA
jgi:hypothetical protein